MNFFEIRAEVLVPEFVYPGILSFWTIKKTLKEICEKAQGWLVEIGPDQVKAGMENFKKVVCGEVEDAEKDEEKDDTAMTVAVTAGAKEDSRLSWFLYLFIFGLPILCCILWCYYTKKRDRENLEMIERQDQVIKTYKIAQMIISAFERA